MYNSPIALHHYEYYVKSEQKRVQSELDNKDLTTSEREKLVEIQQSLQKELQVRYLQEDAKQASKKIVEEEKEMIPMVWQEIKHAEDQLMYIQKQLNIAFESQTANAIQLWLNNMNSNSFKIHQDLLTDCEQTIKLDQ